MKVKPIADWWHQHVDHKDPETGDAKKNGADPGMNAEAAKSKCDTYDEHHMTLEELAERYPGVIDVGHPTKSKGLTQAEADNRLARDGPVGELRRCNN